jgi:aryl-alcohol dehydrogenase-like predicted oxidoreductase
VFRESGGTFIDTGNFYAAWLPGCSGGESESTIGAWMKERGIRDEMAIATKLGFDYPGRRAGLSAEIERECEKSLRRLQTDRLDLYYAHRDDPDTPLAKPWKPSIV